MQTEIDVGNEFMREFIILRGNSGSGKTSVAKNLQQLFGPNIMLISQDVIRREIFDVIKIR